VSGALLDNSLVAQSYQKVWALWNCVRDTGSEVLDRVKSDQKWFWCDVKMFPKMFCQGCFVKAEAPYLQGLGISRQRQAKPNGLRDSVAYLLYFRFVPAFSEYSVVEYSVVERAWALPAGFGHQHAAPGDCDSEKAWQTSQVGRGGPGAVLGGGFCSCRGPGHQQAAPGDVGSEKVWQTSQVGRAFRQHSCARCCCPEQEQVVATTA
jgi:hypothetical protein